MKIRFLTLALLFFGGVALFTSCEKSEDCGECEKVYYENGSETDRESAGTYCGENLEEKEQEEESFGTQKVTYECES